MIEYYVEMIHVAKKGGTYEVNDFNRVQSITIVNGWVGTLFINNSVRLYALQQLEIKGNDKELNGGIINITFYGLPVPQIFGTFVISAHALLIIKRYKDDTKI